MLDLEWRALSLQSSVLIGKLVSNDNSAYKKDNHFNGSQNSNNDLLNVFVTMELDVKQRTLRFFVKYDDTQPFLVNVPIFRSLSQAMTKLLLSQAASIKPSQHSTNLRLNY